MGERLRRGAGLVALLLLAGCATRAEQDEQRLASFAADFAGLYEMDPAATGTASVAGPQLREEAARLAIQRIRVPLVATHVFYVHEASAVDPRRVFAQRVWSATVAADGRGVVLTPHELVDPARWRDGDRNPDFFKAMLPQDLRPRPECAVSLRDADGAWQGRSGGACRAAVPGATQAVPLQTEVEISAEGIFFAERQLDAGGRVLQQREADAVRRYRRRGG